MKQHIKPCTCEVCEKDRWVHKCSDGFHFSFWATVVTSPQWLAWEDEMTKRMKAAKIRNGKVKSYAPVFDVDECRECGQISDEHFQEFLKFTRKT